MLHYLTVVLQGFVDLEPQRCAKVCLHSKITFQMLKMIKIVPNCDTNAVDNLIEICTYLVWIYSCEFSVSAQNHFN